MARPMHPDTLFHLVPTDTNTRAILRHEQNSPFVSKTSIGEEGLEIGYHVSTRPRGGRVIARLGRDADLILPGGAISKVHIAFEVHPTSRAILLCVRTEKRQSVVIGPIPFKPGGEIPQRVLVPGEGFSISIGESSRAFHFSITWRLDESSTQTAVDQGFRAAQERAVNPRWLKTDSDGASDTRSWYNTRLQSRLGVTDIVRQGQVRDLIGIGGYGGVFRGVDLDTGNFIAIKVVTPMNDKEWASLHREIKTMQTLSHPHIIDLLGHEGWNPGATPISKVHMYMPLKTGTAKDLESLPSETSAFIVQEMAHQMLSALDYLATRSLCHRDVKPANILYDVIDGHYKFQLADFGLINSQPLASTYCGTRLFTAPELYRDDHGLTKYPQTPKMDVWSLFVTIASLVPATNFDREKLAASRYSEILAFVRGAAEGVLSALEPMARVNPELRASAAQMLILLFQGQGLTTSRSAVGPIPEISGDAPTEPPPYPAASAYTTHLAGRLPPPPEPPRHYQAQILHANSPGLIFQVPRQTVAPSPAPQPGALIPPRLEQSSVPIVVGHRWRTQTSAPSSSFSTEPEEPAELADHRRRMRMPGRFESEETSY